jgi:hypothetical protein
MEYKICRRKEFDIDEWMGVQGSSLKLDLECGRCDELKLIGAKKRIFKMG